MWPARCNATARRQTKTEDAMKRNKTVALVGAGVGLTLFIVVGLLPALMYGGYAGLLLANGIFGTAGQMGLFARGLVLFGMLLGVFGTASVFAVAGAATASAAAHIASLATP